MNAFHGHQHVVQRPSHFVSVPVGSHTSLFPRPLCPQSSNIYPSFFPHCPGGLYLFLPQTTSLVHGVDAHIHCPKPCPLGRFHLIYCPSGSLRNEAAVWPPSIFSFYPHTKHIHLWIKLGPFPPYQVAMGVPCSHRCEMKGMCSRSAGG